MKKKKTSPQVYVRDVIRRHKNYTTCADKILSKHKQGRGKSLIRRELVPKLSRKLRMGISKRYTTERNQEAPKEVEETVHDNGGAPGGTFL